MTRLGEDENKEGGGRLDTAPPEETQAPLPPEGVVHAKLTTSDVTGMSVSVTKKYNLPFPVCHVEAGAWETRLIDSRDPGPILRGMLSLDLLKLEGGRGGGIGMTLLAITAHRRAAQTAL